MVDDVIKYLSLFNPYLFNCDISLLDALVKGDKVLVNKVQQPEYNDEGLLAVFSSGSWRPLCVSSVESHQMASTVCTSLGFR